VQLIDKTLPAELFPARSLDGALDFINLEARGGNYLTKWQDETRDVEVLTTDELRFTFATDLSRGGHLDGCVDLFLSTL
jgi:hypothetical protein